MTRTNRARRIAYVPALAGFAAFPASYKVAFITPVDAAQDGQICSAAGELAPLRTSTASIWDMAVETTEGEGREDAEKDRDAALACWDEAIRLLDDVAAVESDLPEIRAQLEQARALAEEWGDDDTERRALAMLGGET